MGVWSCATRAPPSLLYCFLIYWIEFWLFFNITANTNWKVKYNRPFALCTDGSSTRLRRRLIPLNRYATTIDIWLIIYLIIRFIVFFFFFFFIQFSSWQNYKTRRKRVAALFVYKYLMRCTSTIIVIYWTRTYIIRSEIYAYKIYFMTLSII